MSQKFAITGADWQLQVLLATGRAADEDHAKHAVVYFEELTDRALGATAKWDVDEGKVEVHARGVRPKPKLLRACQRWALLRTKPQ